MITSRIGAGAQFASLSEDTTLIVDGQFPFSNRNSKHTHASPLVTGKLYGCGSLPSLWVPRLNQSSKKFKEFSSCVPVLMDCMSPTSRVVAMTISKDHWLFALGETHFFFFARGISQILFFFFHWQREEWPLWLKYVFGRSKKMACIIPKTRNAQNFLKNWNSSCIKHGEWTQAVPHGWAW